MKKKLLTYYKIWKITALNAWQEAFVNRATNLLFMIGKIIRFSMSLLFLFLIKHQVGSFAGYTTDQIIIFFLTFQFVDVSSQVFYRGVYLFRDKIRTGEFDFYLAKPINPLFTSLTGKPDINDTIFLLPTTLLSIYLASTLDIKITFISLSWYLLLLINTFLIASALHILVLVVGVLSTEVEGVIWLYRDLMQLGRFPITVYLEPIKLALFFIIPIGMMITIPTEILLQLTPTYSITLTFAIGISSLFISLKLWNWSLKKYSSASS